MNWTQLKVTVKIEVLEEVCAIMSMLDNGLMIEDYSDIDMETVYADLIDESILKSDKSIASVSIYIPDEKNYNEYISFLKERFTTLSIEAKVELIGIAEEEWATAWKKYYKPINVGEHVVIVPMWEEYIPKENEIIVKMDPGMAFGTGTHETTRLCVTLIEKYIKPNDCMIDIGTGSGILSICASKLGVKSVNAYDIDPVAIRVAKENIENNYVTNINCEVSDLLQNVSGLYTFACANIVADIIIRMADDIGNYLEKGSLYITSGIIDERANDVIEAMTQTKFTLIEQLHENGWVAFVWMI